MASARAASAAGIFLFLALVGSCAYRGLNGDEPHSVDAVGAAFTEQGFALRSRQEDGATILLPLVGDSFAVYVFDSVGRGRDVAAAPNIVGSLREAFQSREGAPVLSDLNVVVAYEDDIAPLTRERLVAAVDELRS